MTTFIAPELAEPRNPSLGRQVTEFIEERCVFGSGPLQGQRVRLNDDEYYFLNRAYELLPTRGDFANDFAGCRRFERAAVELADAEQLAAWIAFAELHPEAPVRFGGFHRDGSLRQGVPVRSNALVLLVGGGFDALRYAVEHSPDADFFECSPYAITRLDTFGRDGGIAAQVSTPRSGGTFIHVGEAVSVPQRRLANAVLNHRCPDRSWALFTSTHRVGSVFEEIREEAETGVARDLLFFSRPTAEAMTA
jgi:hypothetical protein